MFIGRENELAELNRMYDEDKFHLFVLYGRRRVGKTTLLNEFCKGKKAIFFSAEQSNAKLNLEKFSSLVFAHYKEETLAPFLSWEMALSYINNRQKQQRLVLVIDEFPYLVRKDKALLSEFQHLIDHTLQFGRLFIVICGSYMGFMEKEVLSAKSPLFGRRTGQLHIKPFDYQTSMQFLDGFDNSDKLKLYGAFGGTALYLQQISPKMDFEPNIKNAFLRPTAYLYEEPLLLLRQEVQEPSIYSAIIEAIAGDASKCNEIATKIGEEPSKCLKYIGSLCELGILFRETPFGEKTSSRRTIYGISDLMFRFWYRYVFANRSLLETGAQEVVFQKRIADDYATYMGSVFERVCKDYLLKQNAAGKLPILFTDIGRWWGSDPATRQEIEIDLIAKDGNRYLICECKWKNEKIDSAVLDTLTQKADVFCKNRDNTYYALFSKSGFSQSLLRQAKQDSNLLLFSLDDLMPAT